MTSHDQKSIVIAIVGNSTVADYPFEDQLRGWEQILEDKTGARLIQCASMPHGVSPELLPSAFSHLQ